MRRGVGSGLRSRRCQTLLKAVEMQARLAKLLSDEFNVNHRHELLDDADTEVLLSMRKEIEIRRAKQKKLVAIQVVNSKSISPSPP